MKKVLKISAIVAAVVAAGVAGYVLWLGSDNSFMLDSEE